MAIGFQKVARATQILVKVSRLTVNSSAPKPHFPLHRFSESGVSGLVQGRRDREGEKETIAEWNRRFSSRKIALHCQIRGRVATPGGRRGNRSVESGDKSEKAHKTKTLGR